ncbi:MAG: efflux RND transporter permease subunit [Candidatus Hydrogenedentes bacterium]|nr:efflux RND transporter permease subunit [Candidatus Hydrogenedentota bacterium]
MGQTIPDLPEKHYSLPVRRPVTIAMAFVTMCVFGWKSYQELPINLMPDISYPTLTVRTEYEGAAPEDVEKLVTRPLEEQLSIVSGLIQCSSTSSAGLSEIVLEFNWGTDMNVAQQDVRDRLDLFEPPKEVTEKPVILRFDPTLDPVFRIAITGKDLSYIADPKARERENQKQLTELREACERYIKGDLESEQGIAQAEVKGGREAEVQVLVDSERIKSYGLTLESVVTALRQQNINLSGGSLREGKAEYLVRTVNEWQRVDEIKDSIIAKNTRLSEVATVQLGEKDRESVVRVNGHEAVELQIYKWGDANTVKVCNTVRDLFGLEREKSTLEKLSAWMNANAAPPENAQMPAVVAMYQLQKELEEGLTLTNRLPQGAELHVVSDQSRFIKAAIDEVQSAAIWGSVLAVLVLYIFLQEIRATIIMNIALPISILTTFIPMFLQDLSLNIMSLGGLAMGVGMLTDNSIVVMESIQRCHDEGDDPKDAVERGTQEVYGPVLASTLTTTCVFLPLAFVQGVAGQLFKDHALTVTYSLIASLLVALYLNPMIAAREKLKFTAVGDGVWVLAAYRRGRKDGNDRVVSLLMMPVNALILTAEWLLDEFWHDIHPIVQWLKNSAQALGEKGIRAVPGFLLALVLAPVAFLCMLILFCTHCLLRSVIQFFVTLFFLITVVFGALFGLFGWTFNLVFWLPLKAFNVAFDWFKETYTVVLTKALKFSPAVLALTIVLFIHAISLVPNLGGELIPPMNQGEFTIRMEAPPGTRLEETERRAATLERVVMEDPEVGSIAVEIGQEKDQANAERGENVAEFAVILKNPKEQVARQAEIMDALRQKIAGVSSDQVTFAVPSLFSFKTAVELHVKGDDYKALREVGNRTIAAIRDIPGVKDPELNMRQGYPEIIVELDRDLLAAKSITPEQVATRLRTEVQGDLPTTLSRQGDKVDIRVRADRSVLNSVADLRRLSVTDSNPPIPLESVAKITVQDGPSEVRRIDQRQVAVISANVEGRDLQAVMDDILAVLPTVERPVDYTIEAGGQDREFRAAYSSLKFALLLAVFLVYVVMACQFESLLHPALVMTTIPMAAIGVVYTLDVMNIPLSILVYIGVICLAGIVTNNAIVLVDYTNLLIDRGMRRAQAVVEAGRIRMRPVFMTTITTILGLLPMAFATGEGDEIRRPMAITLIAGLCSSTVLTLVLIPMVYYLFGGRDAKPQED